jgi:hypothetical protein
VLPVVNYLNRQPASEAEATTEVMPAGAIPLGSSHSDDRLTAEDRSQTKGLPIWRRDLTGQRLKNRSEHFVPAIAVAHIGSGADDGHTPAWCSRDRRNNRLPWSRVPFGHSFTQTDGASFRSLAERDPVSTTTNQDLSLNDLEDVLGTIVEDVCQSLNRADWH